MELVVVAMEDGEEEWEEEEEERSGGVVGGRVASSLHLVMGFLKSPLSHYRSRSLLYRKTRKASPQARSKSRKLFPYEVSEKHIRLASAARRRRGHAHPPDSRRCSNGEPHAYHQQLCHNVVASPGAPPCLFTATPFHPPRKP